MSLPVRPSRRAVLRHCAGLTVLLAALPTAGAALAEPAEPLPGFTVAQLIRKMEKFFPVREPNAGTLLSADGVISYRLPATNGTAELETLGEPDAVQGFAFAYDASDQKGRQQSRHWAGLIIRNALPDWREGKKWARRAMVQAEKAVGEPEASETADGYWITVSNPEGRVIVAVRPADVEVHEVVPSLGISQAQLLAGLASAFPRRDEGKGTLFNGPGSVSDRYFSDNSHAELETLGAAEDLVGLRYLYALRDDDHPEATRNNRGYAFTLLRNVFPGWSESEAWLRAAIEKAEGEANRNAEPSVTDRAGIRVQVGYFVGATESIEIKVFPKGTQI